jgi:conjugative relaxase-like TrwC/TraI family protein
VLNIGKLSSGAAEYYIGEVASATEDYYTGHGEAAGRWVGSIAHELGLEGTVDPDHFRRVLNGQHPFLGEYLVSARGSATRAKARQQTEAASDPALAERVDTLRAAAHLGVSGQYVRRLLTEGDAYRTKLVKAGDGEEVAEPSAYLLGDKADGDGRYGSDSWSVTRHELERFVERRRETKARPGYDLTLRPPKSVSVLWALAEPDQRAAIRDAHRAAVDQVVRYYESRAVFVRHGGGARRLTPAGGIVAAAFDHRASRAGDPLLHTHVVTANMTSTINPNGEVEWRTIPGAGLFEHAKAAGHLYQAHLRHLMTARLGFEFGPVLNGHADVVGVPDRIVEVFSKRRAEIAEMLSEAGSTSAKAAQIATLETRKAKDYGVDTETIEAGWRTEAGAADFGTEEVAACFGRATVAELATDQIDMLMETLGGAHGLTERSATFARTDVIEAIASAVGSAATARRVEELADRFLASNRAQLVDRSPLVEVAEEVDDPQRDPQQAPQRARVRRSSTQKLYTTPELAELEERLLAAATEPRRAAVGVSSEVIDAAIAERPELSAEQRLMVRAACESTELIQPISGRPGAGKTYATEAVVAAHVAAGVPIVGCSVSAAAAAELESAAGFTRSTGAPAMTVARLLMELDGPYGGFRPGTVVVVDEASMIGTRDLARLTAAARAASGAVKLFGDPDQHGAVDVGGVFRRLCADRGDGLVALVENNRQQDHVERLAVTDYREGRVTEALARYDEAGKVVRSRTAGESFDGIVADWYADRINGHADPMIAGPNSTRRALNERARALLKANGELAGETLTVAGREFQVGDVVVARRNERTLHAAGLRDYVKNGSAGTVAGIADDSLVVRFEREGAIRVPHRYLAAGHLEHGYARTTYGVQGATHDTARYHPTDVSSFEEGYVAITRARVGARIYVVDGNLPGPDDDLSHAPDEPRPFGMAEVAAALGRRRGGHMAADAASGLSAVAATLDGHTLAQLTQRRRHLGRTLEQTPPAVDHVIDDTERTLDALRARRNAWSETIDHPVNGTADDDAGARAPSQQATSAVAHLDRAIASQERKLAAANLQQTDRHEWLAEHADVVTEHALVVRAERARETQVRVAAIHDVPEALIRLIGPEPSLQRDRHAWRNVVETIALYRDRYEVTTVGRDGERAVLGDRPTGGLARAEYAEAARLIADAQVSVRSADLVSGVEL